MIAAKLLLTGGDGQLGRSIQRICESFPFELIATDINELDIKDNGTVETYLSTIKPDFLINCAAYTAVDQAEEDLETAFSVNKVGPLILSESCEKLNIPLIHISTDYVFDGESKVPYRENDDSNPLTVYGMSKLEGEQAILKSGVKGLIIRTSWLYSEYGQNFFKTMIKLGTSKDKIDVVSDQFGSPTYAGDLAEAILSIISITSALDWHKNKMEIYHFANSGNCSWFEFASAIMKNSGLNCKVMAVSTEEFPRPAKRPEFSILDTGKIRSKFNIDIPYWEESLRVCIQQNKSI